MSDVENDNDNDNDEEKELDDDEEETLELDEKDLAPAIHEEEEEVDEVEGNVDDGNDGNDDDHQNQLKQKLNLRDDDHAISGSAVGVGGRNVGESEDDKDELEIPFDEFDSRFEPHSFINSLTYKLIPKEDGKPASDQASFDPARFGSLFHGALTSLVSFRDSVDSELNECGRLASMAEQAHKKNLHSLNSHFSGLFNKFKRLDSSIQKVANTAVRIGHTLERLDEEKKNTQRGKRMISLFLEFNQTDNNKLNQIYLGRDKTQEQQMIGTDENVNEEKEMKEKSFRDGKDKKTPPTALSAANSASGGNAAGGAGGKSLISELEKNLHFSADLIQTLHEIAQDIHVQLKGVDRAKENIARKANEIENELLSKFQDAMKNNRIDEMKKHTKTLLNFQGKAVIKRFVFEVMSELEVQLKKYENTADSDSSADTLEEKNQNRDHFLASVLKDENSRTARFSRKLWRFYRCVLGVIKSYSQMSLMVFPQPQIPIKSILERVFEANVLSFLDNELNSPQLTPEEYLNGFYVALVHTETFAARIQTVLKTLSAQYSSNSQSASALAAAAAAASSHSSSIQPSASSSSAASSASSSSSSASASVSASTSASTISEFSYNLSDHFNELFHRHRMQYVDRERAWLLSEADRLIQKTKSKEPPKADLPEESDFFGRKKRAIQMDQKQKWIILVLKDDAIDKIINLCRNSIARADKLSDPAFCSENIGNLFQSLLSRVLDSYIHFVFDDGARDFLPPLDSKDIAPDLWFLQVISLTNRLVEKLQIFYSEVVAPKVSIGLALVGVSSLRIRESLVPLEQKALLVLERCLNSSLKYVQRILQKNQKSTDYRPKDESALLDPAASKACDAVCAYLTAVFETLLSSLEGKNLDKFLSVYGSKLYITLVEHFHTLSVSQIGAGLLSRDVKDYDSVVREFYLPAVSEKFAELRAVCHLFFVNVDNLRALILTDAKLSKMDPHFLHDFIKMRTDYSTNRAKILALLRLDGSTTTNAPNSTTNSTSSAAAATPSSTSSSAASPSVSNTNSVSYSASAKSPS